MSHDIRVASKLAEVLKSTGYECSIDGTTIVIPKWGLRVVVFEGNENSDGMARVFPSVVAFHRFLPGGFARELGVGMGNTIEEAADMISAGWMLLFFPLMKFMFDDQPHDCFVHEEPVSIPQAKQEYRLIAGPVQTRGFDGEQRPDGMSQTFLWNTFSDLLIPKIRHGTHHLRCFVARYGEHVNGDVFLDGEEWAEGSTRLRELAAGFPEPDEKEPMYSMKQHLILRPEDLAAGVNEEEDERVARWMEALDGRVSEAHREVMPRVLMTLCVMARRGREEESEQALIEKGVPEQLAARLVTFGQSTAARVILAGKTKIEFSDTYFWCNSQTRQAVERRYDQTPAFTAAMEVFGLLKEMGLAEAEISAAAEISAEMNGVSQMLSEGKTVEGRFTSMIHSTGEAIQGEDIDELWRRREQALQAEKARKAAQNPPLRRPAPKPWWKFL